VIVKFNVEFLRVINLLICIGIIPINRTDTLIKETSMHPKRFSSMSIMRYSEMVCNAVQLGVNLDDIISETRKYHGYEFTSKVEKVVKTLIAFN